MKHTADTFATGPHFVNAWSEQESLHGDRYTVGLIALPSGFVSVYMKRHYTSLRYVTGERCYEWKYARQLPQRTAITEAKKLAAEAHT